MIHHLVVDLVSWQVLLEDLESLGDVFGEADGGLAVWTRGKDGKGCPKTGWRLSFPCASCYFKGFFFSVFNVHSERSKFQGSFRWSEDFDQVTISVCTPALVAYQPRKLLLYQLGLAGSSKLTAVTSSFKELLGLMRWECGG